MAARPQGSAITTLIAARPEGTQAADDAATTLSAAPSVAPSAAPASEGFSEIALEAAVNGGLTAAEQPSFTNTIGLDIE